MGTQDRLGDLKPRLGDPQSRLRDPQLVWSGTEWTASLWNRSSVGRERTEGGFSIILMFTPPIVH